MVERLAANGGYWAGRIVLGMATIACIGLLAWGGSTLVDVKAGQMVLASGVADMKADIARIETALTAATASRYTSEQAGADRSSLLSLIEANASRIDAHDETLRKIEVLLARIDERMAVGEKP
jgi:hypothetical protein